MSICPFTFVDYISESSVIGFILLCSKDISATEGFVDLFGEA